MKSLMSLPTDAAALVSTAASFSRVNGMAVERSFDRVAFDQGTAAWHDWRKQGIGASDAPTIMGENPFSTLGGLLEQKLAAVRTNFETPSMALGVKLEPEARHAYCLHVGADVEPACVQSTQHTWMRASLDGLSADGERVVEIKCGRAAYWRTAKTQRPPSYYMGQLQHILAVTGLPTIDFVCHFPMKTPIFLTVERDEVYIEKLIRAEEKFWSLVLELRAAQEPMRAAA